MTPTTMTRQRPASGRADADGTRRALRAGDRTDITSGQYTNGVPETFRGQRPPAACENPRRAVTPGERPFVTFEGIEGSGKTTQVARAAAWMQAEGLPVLATRNPGGTELGRLLRDALLHSRGHIDAGAELLLMMADRRHHLKTMIEPALAEGTHVLCDRYTDASRAYQGAGRGLGEKRVDELHERWCRRDPDRTYLFDLPVDAALARVAQAPRRVVRPIRRGRQRFPSKGCERRTAGAREWSRSVSWSSTRRPRRTPSFFHSKKIFDLSSSLLRGRAMSGAPVVLLAGPGSARLEALRARRGGRRHLRQRLRCRVVVRAARLPARSIPTSWSPRPQRTAAREPPAFEEGDDEGDDDPDGARAGRRRRRDAPPLRGGDARDRLPRRGPHGGRRVQRAPEDPRGAADEDALRPHGDTPAPPATDDPLARRVQPVPGTRDETAAALVGRGHRRRRKPKPAPRSSRTTPTRRPSWTSPRRAPTRDALLEAASGVFLTGSRSWALALAGARLGGRRRPRGRAPPPAPRASSCATRRPRPSTPPARTSSSASASPISRASARRPARASSTPPRARSSSPASLTDSRRNVRLATEAYALGL